jgi:transcriptional regulator with XRE-family HTH domain
MVHYKLKALLEEKGYSQQEVADAIHISQNTLSNIETGKTKVDVELLFKFAEFYKVKPQELITDNSLTMQFNDKVENGYASFIQTLNADNKELIIALKEQLTVKDAQIAKLLELLKNNS